MATAADIYAQAQSDALKKQLQNLYTNQQNSYNALTESNAAAKQQLLDELTRQSGLVEDSYQNNSNQAYISKVLSDKTLKSNLNRLGLADSGYGVGKMVDNTNVYGTNLKDLQTAKNTSLDTINTNRLGVESNYAQKASELLASHNSALSDIDRYISEAGTAEYNNAYSRYLNEIQAQSNIAANNAAISASFTDNSFNGESGGGTQSGAIIISTPYYNDIINPDVQYGTFNTKDSNGIRYQPNNVGGVPISNSTGKKVKDIFGTGNKGKTGANIDNQKIWSTKDGKHYIWDGSQNKYIDVTQQYLNAVLAIPKKKKW